MTPRKILQVLAVAAALTAGSCKSISHVHDFAGSAEKITSLYGDINFTAGSYCRETICIDPKSFLTGNIIETNGCSCKDFTDADNTIRAINSVLLNYFDGLAALSDKHASAISFSDISTAAASISGNANISITTEEIKTVSDLSSGISSVLVSTKRRSQLKKIIAASDVSIKAIIAVQRRNMDYLANILRLQTEESTTVIRSMQARSAEPAVKYLLGLELNRRLSIDKQQKQLLAKYSNGLQKIDEGHNQLFTYRESIKDPEFRKRLLAVAGSLRTAYQDFKSFK